MSDACACARYAAKLGDMDDADLLRNRARQQGHPDYADELTSFGAGGRKERSNDRTAV